ncbi:MAG: type III secretion system HrpP C-terminal domain-containing protein [Pseudomonas sp.]|uniref:type III secretion system HrpP C-terminal domain-containing protein n=1 Tax=Pseudomonas sp. TaxID=306 RepID=UPI003C748E7D
MRTEPIKHPAPPPAPKPSTTVPPTAAYPASTPVPRRIDVLRNRAADTRPPSDSSRQLEADGALFEQLIAPLPDGGSDQSDSREGGGSSFSMFTALDGVPTQLIDELALQLPDVGNRPFSATLLMPNLGKVQIQAQKNPGHWAIRLSFSRRDVLERLTRHQTACEEAFSKALDHDVELSLQPAGDA